MLNEESPGETWTGMKTFVQRARKTDPSAAALSS
jgi:hypothetical protein